MAPKVGDKRANGGAVFQVVAVDSKNVYVKRADEGKKALADKAGAHAVAKEQFEGWPEK